MDNPEKIKPNNNIDEETPETGITFEQQMLSLMGDFGIPEDCFIDFTKVCFEETSRSINLYFQKDYSALRDFSSPAYQDAIRKMNEPILRIRTAMDSTQKGRQFISEHQLPEDTIPIVPLLSPKDEIHPILYMPITINPELEEKRAELLEQISHLFSYKHSEKGMKEQLELERFRNSEYEGLRMTNVHRSLLNLPPITETQLTTRNRIVESGIADRMLASLKAENHIMYPLTDLELKDCDFKVLVKKDPDTGKKITYVAIEYPNPNPLNKDTLPKVGVRFGVEKDRCFGSAGEEPLSNEQFQLVQELANQSVLK